MYYRIAEITLQSEIVLPSFTAFECDPANVDVTLIRTAEQAPAGKEIVSGEIIHRVLPDGWFCHRKWTDEEGLFISRDYTVLRYLGKESVSAAFSAERYVRLALECLLIRRGYVSLHAAAVDRNGLAYAFTGPSGIGKSTRARLWMESLEAKLISGDRPLIRPETLELFGVPWDGKEQCFRNVHFPLKAVCEVRRGKTFQVRKLSPAQARRLLVQQCFLPMWDTETAVLQMRNISLLARKAKMLRVFSEKSAENAKCLYEAILNEQYLKEEPDVKVKTGFVLRNIADEYMLMPTDENIAAYNGAVLLNEVSAFIWEKLQNPMSREDLLAAVLDEFETDEATASKDLDALLEKLNQLGLMETMAE